MPRMPFFGFPYQFPYQYNGYYANKKNNVNNEENSKVSNKNNNQFKYRQPFSFNFDGFSDVTKPVAELLGINLYLDDIIILCLLFILYKEEVKDEMLFICLLLLLIT